MLDVTLAGFTDRDDHLSKIIRFNTPRFTPMFYRTNLLIHSRRVFLLVQDLLQTITKTYGDRLDREKVLTLALVHDDAELLTGDIQLYHKERMSAEQLATVDQAEAEAIEVLAARWPRNANGYDYRQLLLEALHKDTLESQVVSYTDKLDASCESLHELHAGNRRFLRPAKNYVHRIKDFPQKFPELQPLLFSDHHPLLRAPRDFELTDLPSEATHHTTDSLHEPTAFPHYDRWRALTVEHLSVHYLSEVRERIET